MEMSIEYSIKYLTAMRKTYQADTEVLSTAISTMSKYQKIKELYDYWRSGKCEYTISCMENIGKVLKDGNDD